MNHESVLDVSSLPPYDVSNKSVLFLGQVLVCLIEASVFFVLIATYYYLRINVDVWPPPGTPALPTTIPTLSLIPLAASCVASYFASEAAKKDDRRGMVLSLTANLILACVFLAMRAVAWKDFPFGWDSDAHGSIVWSLLFIHTLDIVADLVITGTLIVILLKGPVGGKQRIGVHVDSVIWYFLAGIWVPLYAVIYWSPYFIGTGR